MASAFRCCVPPTSGRTSPRAVSTRPAHLSNSGYTVDEREIAALHEIYSQGMDPEELAGHVKAAIEENRFYIIPYPEARPMLEAAFQQVLDALPPPDSDRGRPGEAAPRDDANISRRARRWTPSATASRRARE